jgi:hypothetical protein
LADDEIFGCRPRVRTASKIDKPTGGLTPNHPSAVARRAEEDQLSTLLPGTEAPEDGTASGTNYNESYSEPRRIVVSDQHRNAHNHYKRWKEIEQFDERRRDLGRFANGCSAATVSGYHSLNEKAKSMTPIGVIHAVQKLSG